VHNSPRASPRRPGRRPRPVEAQCLDGVAAPGIAPEDADALWAALRTLAPRQRRVVVLRHYWGLSVEETAADLGVSAGTVKSQTHDALARLRAALTEAHEPLHPRPTDGEGARR
jgi:DNA-directed RNA polymerase specialized sigma24 family protein